MISVFWISISENAGTMQSNRWTKLRITEYIAHMTVWGFYISTDIAFIDHKGFGELNNSIQLVISASILFVNTTAFLIYGFRILRRLESIGEMSTSSDRRTQSLISDNSNNDMNDLRPKRFQPSHRIRKMLYLTVSITFICIITQLYVAVHSDSTSDLVTIQCANGSNCEKLHVPFVGLHALQFFAVIMVLWTFRKIRPRQAVDRNDSSSDSLETKNTDQIV